MNAERADKIIQYALLCAGREDGHPMLGPIHLIKYVYLADLAYAEANDGTTYTCAQWQFFHYGPWAIEVNARIEPSLHAIDAAEVTFESNYDSDMKRWQKVDDEQLAEIERVLPLEVRLAVRSLVHKFGSDTSELLHYVYKTQPILNAKPEEFLLFHGVTRSKSLPAETRTRSRKEEKREETRREELRRELAEKLRAKTEAFAEAEYATSPRYDDVYFQGVASLDAAEYDTELKPMRGELTVDESLGIPLYGASVVTETRIQEFAKTWWEPCSDKTIQRGQLIRAYAHHIEYIPYTLVPEGRVEPERHDKINYRIEQLRSTTAHKKPTLPVAALPDELYLVYRGKFRPCLVISVEGMDIEKSLHPSTSPSWQYVPSVLVAPYYGTEQNDKRAGWHSPFIDRIRKCEYPQYMLDVLPFPRNTMESVLRFDHIQPIGSHYQSYEATPHKLSNEALIYMDEWFDWLRIGQLAKSTLLSTARECLSP